MTLLKSEPKYKREKQSTQRTMKLILLISCLFFVLASTAAVNINTDSNFEGKPNKSKGDQSACFWEKRTGCRYLSSFRFEFCPFLSLPVLFLSDPLLPPPYTHCTPYMTCYIFLIMWSVGHHIRGWVGCSCGLLRDSLPDPCS